MMSTLEASQDIRSLPSDDMKDMVDASFPLDGHKDFKDDSVEPIQEDPSGDSSLNTPKDPQSPDDVSEEVKALEDDLPVEEPENDSEMQIVECENSKSENNSKVDEEKCESVVEEELEPVSNGSVQESEGVDTPKGDSVDFSAENSQEMDYVSEEASREADEKPCETEEDTQDDFVEETSSKVDEDIEDIAEESVDSAVEAEAPKEETMEEDDSPKSVPDEEDARKDTETEDIGDKEDTEKTIDPPEDESTNVDDINLDNDVEKTMDENDSTKSSESDDIIDLDDMLKEIGVDNTESIPELSLETKNTDTKPDDSSNVTTDEVIEEKPQVIEDDDDVVMMDLDEAASKSKEPEEKPEEELKEAESKGPDEDVEESEVCNIFKECDELLNSIADDKVENDAEPSIALDEDSADVQKKENEPESDVQDKDDSLKLIIDESVAEKEEPTQSVQEESKEPITEAEPKISENDEVSNTEADETTDKSHADLGNSSDDVLIIDDEPESSDVAEKVEPEESEVKESEKSESPEKKDEEKPEEILKPTEMDIDEDTEPQLPSKDDEPKNPPSQEPIPIDDDDLSLDEKDESMDKMGNYLGSKRPSNSLEYEEKSKRLKLSDESEKDTDTNSQSSVSSKKNELLDSTSRQSDNSGESLKMTLRLRKNDKGKLEAEKISQAEKDVGSLLTPLPKKTSMEFMTMFKKPYQDMSHADLEDLVLQKIAEMITHKSEYSEMRKKIEKQEEMISLYRTKLAELSKNFHDLEVVYKRVQQDLDNRNSGYVQIPKITRAVGLQVSVSNHRKQHALNDHRTSESVANNTRTSLAAQEAAKKMKPNQRFTPMRPPMSEAEHRHLDAQEQKQRQEMQQQVQQKLALNAANTSSGTTTIAQRNSNIVVLKHTPKPPPPKIISPLQQHQQHQQQQLPYVVKRTAVRTSTVTSTVVTKTVSPAGQAQQRVIMTPSVTQHAQQHAQQSPMHKVALQAQQRSPSVVSPPKKQQVVVDLTDEDDNKAKAKTSMAPSLLNGGIPALVAIPSSSTSKPATKYVMVQQMAATNGQLSKTMPNKYGNRIKMPIAPKPSSELTRAVAAQPNIIRRPPISTTLVASGSGHQRPLKIMTPQRTHPAPLPPFQNQPSQYGMKRIPTRPVIRIKNDEKQGIVISWTMDDLTDDHEEIRDYQIFAYQETSAPPSTDNWRLVGDVKSMMLPMAVTLSQFQEGQRYWFAVRARDVHDRCGMFSVPRTW